MWESLLIVLDGVMQDDPRNMLVNVELISFSPKTEEEQEVSTDAMLDPLNEEDFNDMLFSDEGVKGLELEIDLKSL